MWTILHPSLSESRRSLHFHTKYLGKVITCKYQEKTMVTSVTSPLQLQQIKSCCFEDICFKYKLFCLTLTMSKKTIWTFRNILDALQWFLSHHGREPLVNRVDHQVCRERRERRERQIDRERERERARSVLTKFRVRTVNYQGNQAHSLVILRSVDLWIKGSVKSRVAPWREFAPTVWRVSRTLLSRNTSTLVWYFPIPII